MPYTWYFGFMQDPTEQTKIDNFMVQQLDGTVNEWGWCKQKVFQALFIGCPLMQLTLMSLMLIYVFSILIL